jgi:hypothetical protein
MGFQTDDGQQPFFLRRSSANLSPLFLVAQIRYLPALFSGDNTGQLSF